LRVGHSLRKYGVCWWPPCVLECGDEHGDAQTSMSKLLDRYDQSTCEILERECQARESHREHHAMGRRGHARQRQGTHEAFTTTRFFTVTLPGRNKQTPCRKSRAPAPRLDAALRKTQDARAGTACQREGKGKRGGDRLEHALLTYDIFCDRVPGSPVTGQCRAPGHRTVNSAR
jgi:hypothetical protein